MKMKRFIILTLVLLAVIGCAGILNTYALEDGKRYNWGLVPSGEHSKVRFNHSPEELRQYDTFCIGGPDEKVLYLTFDMGYVNMNAERCVEILDKHDVKASFFILEHVVHNYFHTLKAMHENGHEICNHTLKHKDMCAVTDFEAYSAELLGLESLYKEKTGYDMTKFYRPPRGEFTKQALEYNQKLGFKTIFWSLAYVDWDDKNQPDPTASFKKVIDRTHNGAVILLHPTSETNAKILESLIIEWKRQGYRFELLGHLTA